MSSKVTNRPSPRQKEDTARHRPAPAERRRRKRRHLAHQGEHSPGTRQTTGAFRHTQRRRKSKARSRFAFGKVFGRTFARRLAASVAAALVVIVALFALLRVRNVSVVGNSMYNVDEIVECAGLSQGNALLLVNKTAVASRIRAQLPYIDEVRVGVALPSTVKIEVVELETAFAVAAEDGSYWLINSDGRLVEQITAKAASDYLKIEGVRIYGAVSGENAQVLEEPAETSQAEDDESQMDMPVEASAGKRMDTALQIVRQLEQEQAIRSITSVDVSSIYNLEIWYGTRFQIKLGDSSELSYKLQYMLAAISQLDSYQSGVLDLTFQEAKKATFIPWSS